MKIEDGVLDQMKRFLDFSARKQQATTFMRARCLGSAVVESAWVAAGHVDAYQMLKVNAWDIAAGWNSRHTRSDVYERQHRTGPRDAHDACCDPGVSA